MESSSTWSTLTSPERAATRCTTTPGPGSGSSSTSLERPLFPLGRHLPSSWGGIPLHVLAEVAGGEVVAELLLQRRLDLGARRRHAGDRAARVEAAPRWRVDRRRDLAGQLDQPAATLNPGIRNRDGRQQRFRVG